MDIKLLHGDCLIESKKIKNGSVDLILTDLPYGTVQGIGGYEKSWTHELYIRAVDALDELLKDRTLPDTFV